MTQTETELEMEKNSSISHASTIKLPMITGGKEGKNDEVDVPALCSHIFPTIEHKYTTRDAILYALSTGFSDDPCNLNDLRFTYELGEGGADGQPLHVSPTIAVLWTHALLSNITSIPSLKFNPALLLHGAQEVIVPNALPAEAAVKTSGHISHVFDKGKATLVIFDCASYNKETGELMALNRSTLILRGVGGFKGDRGSLPASWKIIPHSPADLSIHYRIPKNNALLYRLNGDMNPLHADPMIAHMAGFDRPILHGLCSLGIATSILIKHIAGSDPSRVKRVLARFTKHVYPGETLQIKAWIDYTGTYVDKKVFDNTRCVLFKCYILEREEVAVDYGVAEIVDPRLGETEAKL